MTQAQNDKRVVVGQFAGAHGVRGEFKVRSFTEDPENLGAYGPVQTESGKTLTLKLGREVKPSLFIATCPEITTREDCDLYKGAKLTVSRSILPLPDDEDEFYLADLSGLKVRLRDGTMTGRIKSVVNYGAGDIVELIEVPQKSGTVLSPFTKAHFPEVNIAEGCVTMDEEALSEITSDEKAVD